MSGPNPYESPRPFSIPTARGTSEKSPLAARILLSTTSFTVMAAVVALATASVLLVGSIFLAALAQFVAAFWIHRDAHRPR